MENWAESEPGGVGGHPRKPRSSRTRISMGRSEDRLGIYRRLAYRSGLGSQSIPRSLGDHGRVTRALGEMRVLGPEKPQKLWVPRTTNKGK